MVFDVDEEEKGPVEMPAARSSPDAISRIGALKSMLDPYAYSSQGWRSDQH